MTQFEECTVEHIPREENTNADALSQFASSETESCEGKYLLPSAEDTKHRGKVDCPD